MKLTDWIVSTGLLDGGPAVEKSQIIRELLERLADDGHITMADVPVISAEVLRRESLGLTGIGQGVAIPHARSAALSRPIAIVAVCRLPIEFDSLDREPTDIVALCLAPYETPGTNRRVMQRQSEFLMRLLADGVFRDRLRHVSAAVEIAEVLIAAEVRGS